MWKKIKNKIIAHTVSMCFMQFNQAISHIQLSSDILVRRQNQDDDGFGQLHQHNNEEQ